MKTPKITKLLPMAMALMLACPAFAASNNASSEMSLTVPAFINVTKESAVETSSATFNDAYSTITLAPTLNANFKVVTNVPDKVVYLKATAETSDGADGVSSALCGDTSAMYLVFTNTTRKPADTDVQNITAMSGTAKAKNPNAIAFLVTPLITPDGTSGAAEPTIEFSDGKAKYTLKNGVYAMGYTIATSALAETFSTHDTNGTYKATLVMTDANP